MDLSVVIPFYNESQSLEPLLQELFVTLDQMNLEFEVLAIDDGSIDGSFEVAAEFAALRPELVVLRFGRNFGQTAALTAGFDFAKGKYVVTIDADLQNTPSDIPMLVHQLDKGYDVVSGWRRDRQDAEISKKTGQPNRQLDGVAYFWSKAA